MSSRDSSRSQVISRQLSTNVCLSAALGRVHQAMYAVLACQRPSNRGTTLNTSPARRLESTAEVSTEPGAVQLGGWHVPSMPIAIRLLLRRCSSRLGVRW
jgi:hypothetical protein